MDKRRNKRIQTRQHKGDGDNRRQKSVGDFLGLKIPSKVKGVNLHEVIVEESGEEASHHLDALCDPLGEFTPLPVPGTMLELKKFILGRNKDNSLSILDIKVKTI